uniref:Uncharacterized protein n=1 Tax=Palpitomonas bilix TaxID=652834 RepID=A0A7S3G3Y8_9EUKA|mmetsp:Transcript_26936/g.69263  ORF Transcript_26936/g.69263 Transcript_26936/m.69263 type:complete len:109 (+) Transcript_26936:1036-1362(+)
MSRKVSFHLNLKFKQECLPSISLRQKVATLFLPFFFSVLPAPSNFPHSSSWLIFTTIAGDRVWRDLILPSLRCSLLRGCIAPAGSSKKNHRQDQTVFNAVFYSSSFAK